MAKADLPQIFAMMLGEQDLIIADVGAAYGLPAHLGILDSIATICFFEPHAERAKELRDLYAARGFGSRIRVSTSALASTNGPRTLYVTNAPTGSSLLKPGSDAFFEWSGDPDYFYPVRETQVQTRRMEDVLADERLPRIDFAKLDVQGGEYEVLQGFGRHMDTVLGAELEIGFPGGYIEQPSFAELHRYLESHGLVLFDLKPVRGHRFLPKARKGYAEDVFGVAHDAPSLARRLWEADAVYFRSTKKLLGQGDGLALRRLLLLYCAYGFFVEAHHVIAQAHAASIFSNSERSQLMDDVIAWHRRGRYYFTDSTLWRTLRSRLSELENRVTRRILRRRLPGWLDQ
jgi:FkbM family methyltransferase